MNIYQAGCGKNENYGNVVRAVEPREACANQVQNCCGNEENGDALHPNYVFLKCGTPFTTNIPSTTTAGTTFNIANLNVDTSKFHDPCIRFEFAGNISTVAGTFTLNFQVFKQCKYQPVAFPVGPVWTFAKTAATIAENNVFMFPVCDCDVCEKECCNYSVVVTVEALDVEESLVINNATMSAMVVDNPRC